MTNSSAEVLPDAVFAVLAVFAVPCAEVPAAVEVLLNAVPYKEVFTVRFSSWISSTTAMSSSDSPTVSNISSS